MRLAVVLPCADAEATLPAAIEAARAGLAACGEAGELQILVPDGGSSDRTREIAEAAGVRVVRCPVRGYGATVHWGIAAAEGADWVLVADPDGSYDLTAMQALVEAARGGECDLVLGSRMRGTIEPGAMTFPERRVATPLINVLLRLVFGIRTSDSRTGMRLVRRQLYESLNMRCAGIEWTTEHLVKTRMRGGRFREVPIHVRPGAHAVRRGLRRRGDGWRHFRAIVLLAPRATLMLPAVLVAIGGVWRWVARPDAGLALVAVAYLMVLMALGIQMMLHADRVSPSRGGALLYHTLASEIVFVWAAALLGAGGWLLWQPRPELPPSAGPLLLVLGAATVLGNLFFDTVQTHLAADLDRAWTDAL